MRQSTRSLASLARAGVAAGAAAFLAHSQPARAQGVTFTVAPYIWLSGISADVTVGRRSASADASFIDIVDKTDFVFALTGFGAVNWGNWSFYADALWSRMTVDASSGPLSVDATITTTIVDFGAAYQFWLEGAPPQPGVWAVGIQPYVGGRYTRISTSLDGQLTGPLGRVRSFDVSGSESGVDPIIGARFLVVSPEGFHLRLAGDVGGFRLYHDLTWSFSALVGYGFVLFGVPQTGWLGYKAIGYENEKTVRGVPVSGEQVLHGPVLGVSFRF